MSEFEFVQVTIAIILGLGITELLRNMGEQIRRRSEVQVYSLQVASSCLLVLVILRYLWAFWATLEVEWNLPLFLLIVMPAIALALSAQVLRVDCDSIKSGEDQYFENCRATYLFWAAAPLSMVLFDTLSGHVFTAADATRFVVIGLIAALGFVKKAAFHWVVLSALFISLAVGMWTTQFVLSSQGG